MKDLLVICGATASGKTSLAIDCALKLDSEVISADSQLVYKGLNIGTAKPTESEMRGVRHNLIDIVEPWQEFSVSDYERLALAEIERIKKANKVPIICGGTGFYVNSILFSMGYGHTGANIEIRQKYENLLKTHGKDYIYGILKECDAATAAKLHPNDVKRVIRALEIYESTGRPKSTQNDKLTQRYDYLAVAIDYPREELYARINERVDKMFDCGLVDEVKGLLSKGFQDAQCMQAIGYKEVAQCLKNGDNESTMRDIIKQNTRRYAKRQITFFKKMPKLIWLNPSEATSDKITELMNNDV